MKTGFIYVVKQSFILKSMIVAAVINLVLSPLLIVGSPIILRVTMQSSDTMQGLGVALISFASILGTLTIGVFYVIARVQRVTSNENLGKVMAIIMAVAGCAAPIGQVIYGVVFELFSDVLYFRLWLLVC